MEYIYTAVFTPNKDGTKIHAKVPDLPGCISTGRTLDDAIALITDATALWLVAAEDSGEGTPFATHPRDIERNEHTEVTAIRVDTTAYRARTTPRHKRFGQEN